MAKPKYSFETRLAVVEHYLSGNKGLQCTAEYFGVDGIVWKNDRHTPELRTTVVQTILNEKLSMREGAARFNISKETVVRLWVNVYKEAGLEGLLKIKRGRTREVTKKNSHLGH